MDAEQARVEHLKLIEGVIDRLSRLSFAVKAATSTLVAALIAATLATDSPFVAIGAVAVPVLWFIDGFYLWQEKLYRQLFMRVRKGTPPEVGSNTYFDMDASVFTNQIEPIKKIMVRWYLGLYYAVLIGLVLAAAIGTYLSSFNI